MTNILHYFGLCYCLFQLFFDSNQIYVINNTTIYPFHSDRKALKHNNKNTGGHVQILTEEEHTKQLC